MENGLIKFEDIAVIDDKGNSQFEFPHLYVDFSDRCGPFFGFREYLTRHEHQRQPLDGLKRVKRFPPTFDAPRIRTFHRDKTLKIADRTRRTVGAGNALNTLFDVDGRYDFLGEADVIAIEGTQEKVGRTGEPRIVKKNNRHSSGCGPMVVAEHSAEPLSALNRMMG